jgi:hypothetical protein
MRAAAGDKNIWSSVAAIWPVSSTMLGY